MSTYGLLAKYGYDATHIVGRREIRAAAAVLIAREARDEALVRRNVPYLQLQGLQCYRRPAQVRFYYRRLMACRAAERELDVALHRAYALDLNNSDLGRFRFAIHGSGLEGV